MEVTGWDYVLLSNRPPSVVVEPFIELVKTIWLNPIIDEYEEFKLNPNGSHWLFFEKDEEMTQEDIGYTLNKNKEGCFSLITGLREQMELDIQVIKQIVPKPESKGHSYPAKLIMSDAWMYSLVLPSNIKGKFSAKIYRFLQQSLSK